MARATPKVQNTTLIDCAVTEQAISVGTPAWYRWLAQANSFAFVDIDGRFTARKEHRGRADGYWRAYRKCAGKVHSMYLGKSADLSCTRLHDVARALAANVPGVAPVARAADDTLPSAAQLPTGTATILLVDVDHDRDDPTQHAQTISMLHSQLSQAAHAAGGRMVSTSAGPAIVAFASPLDAITAALCVRRARNDARVVIHTGVVTARADEYIDRALSWAAPILAASHSGQILLSHVTHALIGDQLPPDMILHDLGAYRLRDAHHAERLYQLGAPELSTEFSPLRLARHRPHNLPMVATSLIGREDDVAAVVAALQHTAIRLLTLSGPGGVGKTRLALQAATELRDAFVDGVFVIDLALIRHADVVVPTIANTLGIMEMGSGPLLTRLCEYLATKQQLLILDNFEQVVSAAPLLVTLLAAAPQIKLLVTSRAVLHLASEHEFSVLPLALPPRASNALALWECARELEEDVTRYGAVSLFIQRVQAIKPDFVLTRDTAQVIADICQRLDGLPLAIELAAARIKVFSPPMLLERLDHRLHLLTGGACDVPVRQQTLRATIDWSYQLLDDAAQMLLHQLAVFEGSFTLDAASVVLELNATSSSDLVLLNGIAALVDQSLLRPIESQTHSPRFMILDTIREYLLEHLEQSGAAPARQECHAAYYLALAEQIEPELHGPNLRVWLDQLTTELPNLRAALTWMLAQGNIESAARLATALAVFWDVRTYRREGCDWLAKVLASRAALSPAVRATTLHAAGCLARACHDRTTAIALLEESLDLYIVLSDVRSHAAVLTDIGWTIATLGGDMERATIALETGLAQYRALAHPRGVARALQALGLVEQQRALGDQRVLAWALTTLGWVERQRGSLAKARALCVESLALRRAVNDAHGIAWSLTSLGIVAATQGDYGAARAFQEERLKIEQSLSNPHGVAATLQQLGIIAFRQGDTSAARARLVESLAIARAIDDTFTLAFSLVSLGEVARDIGEYIQANALFEEGLAQFRALGDAYRIARIYASLAQVALDTQRAATAYTMATQSVQLAHTLHEPLLISVCLAGLADSAARQGATRWAAQWWGAAAHQAATAPGQRSPVEPVARAHLREAVRAALGPQAFDAAWSMGGACTPETLLSDLHRSDFTRVRTPLPLARFSARPAGLTRRELAVLVLVAEGLSNAQIAAQLVISVATVKTYLSASYAKLGVTSRTAAMRYVIDHQLR